LYLAHYKEDIVEGFTFDKIYMDELQNKILRDGYIFPKNDTLTILLDIKTDATKTYEVLYKLINENYKNIVSYWEKDKYHSSYINLVITGNRNLDLIIDSYKRRYFTADGRLSNLDGKFGIN
jgi:hypothetical protein